MGSAIGGAIGAVGGLLGQRRAAKSADRAADQQMQLSREAQEAAKFKPFAVTSGFGRGFFDTNNQTAGYEIDPRLAGFRDTSYDLSQGVFDQLGQADPQAFAQQVFDEQQDLLAPQRQAQDIALRNQQLSRGRIGMGLSGEAAGAGMGGMVNPEQFQMQAGRSLADAQMAAMAREEGQMDIDRLISRSGGLFNQGAGIEQLGMSPLTMGAEFGGMQSQAGAQAGAALLRGGLEATQSRLSGGLARAQMYSSLGQSLGGMFGGMGGGGGGGGGMMGGGGGNLASMGGGQGLRY